MALTHPAETTLVDKKTVARILGCTPRTVDRLRKTGTLKAARIGGLIRFKVEDIHRAVEEAKE